MKRYNIILGGDGKEHVQEDPQGPFLKVEEIDPRVMQAFDAGVKDILEGGPVTVVGVPKNGKEEKLVAVHYVALYYTEKKQ